MKSIYLSMLTIRVWIPGHLLSAMCIPLRYFLLATVTLLNDSKHDEVANLQPMDLLSIGVQANLTCSIQLDRKRASSSRGPGLISGIDGIAAIEASCIQNLIEELRDSCNPCLSTRLTPCEWCGRLELRR